MTETTRNSALESCVLAVWQRMQRKHLASGLLAMCRWGIPLFFLGMVIDRYAYLPTAGRAVILLVLLTTCLYQAWRQGWCKLQKFDSTRTAMAIEERQGGLNSLLTTAVELGKSGAFPGTSESLCAATRKKAEEVAVDLKPQKIISLASLRIPARIAMALGVAVLLFAIFKGPFLAAGLARIFTPWVQVAYPTKTMLDLGDADLVVKEGASAKILIGVSGDVPDTARLLLQTGDGSPREMDLVINKDQTNNEGQAEYMIESASRDFTYRIKAGDTRSEWHQVRVISAPRIKTVALKLDFPSYIERENETVEALTLTVPEDTNIHWNLELDQAVRQAILLRDGEEPMELKVSDDGRRLIIDEQVDASRGYSFAWVEKDHGFEFTSPRYYLQVAADQQPRVELTSPEFNLNALLGRPLDLAVRAQDDHGIGSTKITYKVNRRPEKTVTLPVPVLIGAGEQKLDWDYRKELPDLQIGDSVSFVVEVADRYPGEGGPHRVSTETRRITFLSREEYLAEITKQMERLLSRVRTLYRQERAAHEFLAVIDPAAESYVSTCQLEAIRQEMVREQLVTTADEVQALLDDLAANQVTDAVESDSLAALRDAMRTIASDHVARAADLLRAQVGADTRDPLTATDAVNQAARELASLVLLRGIDASREVFARETAMLANELTRLRLRLITATPAQSEALAKNVEDIATWTDLLLKQLTDGMRYEVKPLAVLGLSRRIHDLRSAKITDSLRNLATATREGKIEHTNTELYPLIRPLLGAEFTMRSGAEFARIRDLREQLAGWISAQEQLIADAQNAADASTLTARQTTLRNALVLATLPGIPAPRAGLLDLTMHPVPPADERRLHAETLMTTAIAQLHSGTNDEAVARQQEALTALRELDGILARWYVELAKNTLGVSAEVSDASQRITALEQLETRQLALIELAFDEEDAIALLEQQQSLAAELDGFRLELSGGESGPSKIVLPLLGRIETAAKAMENAVTTLRAKQIDDAIDPQELAANALTEARTMAQDQLVKFSLQQQLIGFQQAVTNASSGMVDVLDAQNDLIAATAKADEDQLKSLLASQRNLHQCLSDIAPFLDIVASRLDVGTPLVFAASDVEDALLAMEDGDGEDAAEIQEIAVESLSKVQGLVSEIAVQTGYISEIVEFLHNLQSDALMLAFRQSQLREPAKPEDTLALQESLTTEAKAYGESLAMVAGLINFDTLGEEVLEQLEGLDLILDGMAPSTHMAEALRLIQTGETATEAMQAAEKAFASHAQHINVIIAMLNGLPNIILTSAEPPELHRLIAVLDIASKHRALIRQTQATPEKDLPSLASSQQSLAAAIAKASQFEGLTHPLLSDANSRIATISGMLTASNKATATSAQLAADLTLRHFIIEQALILNTAIPPSSGSDSDVPTEAETDDLALNEAVESISDFVSGEAPKDQKSEWEILGERNRAALNQNFARELPLEFRATLKDYYERVAK